MASPHLPVCLLRLLPTCAARCAAATCSRATFRQCIAGPGVTGRKLRAANRPHPVVREAMRAGAELVLHPMMPLLRHSG